MRRFIVSEPSLQNLVNSAWQEGRNFDEPDLSSLVEATNRAYEECKLEPVGDSSVEANLVKFLSSVRPAFRDAAELQSFWEACQFDLVYNPMNIDANIRKIIWQVGDTSRVNWKQIITLLYGN